MALCTTGAGAHDDKDDANTAAAVAAAVAILGLAALAHSADDHPDGKKYKGDSEAYFERGYRDGLHGEDYDSAYNNAEYGEGFSAGMKERDNRLAHKKHHKSKNKAPTVALRTCVGEASAKWGTNPQRISVIKSKKAGSDDYFVEVAAGHKHGSCEVSKHGEIYNFKNGRI
jgi:hypothetical protein